jgi:hypothetical protein
MSVKCPACGFESPDSAEWCDFCKEPLKKKKGAALIDELKKLPPEKVLERLPQELRKDLSREEKLPAWSPWFRPMAYAFLLLMVGLLVAAAILTATRSRDAGQGSGGSRQSISR